VATRSAIREESVGVGEYLERLCEAESWNESVLLTAGMELEACETLLPSKTFRARYRIGTCYELESLCDPFETSRTLLLQPTEHSHSPSFHNPSYQPPYTMHSFSRNFQAQVLQANQDTDRHRLFVDFLPQNYRLDISKSSKLASTRPTSSLVNC
jgi:hypothetical protein